jgi:hypothetical protein
MRLLHVPRSRHEAQSLHYGAPSWSGESFASEHMASRHDEQLLITRTAPADPYTAWLAKRERARRASSVAPSTTPAGRFTRNGKAKAPWEVILVKLTPDTRRSSFPF